MKLMCFYTIAILLMLGSHDRSANASLYTAASRSAVRSIEKHGFKKAILRQNSRFGKKAYMTPSLKTAQLEKPGAEAVARFNKGPMFDKRVMDTRKMTTAELKKASGMKDLRGTQKKGVIGQKLGHKLGNYAERENKIIAYKSAKDPNGLNYALPEKSYSKSGKALITSGIAALR